MRQRPITMTVLRTALAALIAATGLVLTGPAPAFACSCVMADAAQFVKWADVVVVGRVTDITPPSKSEVVGSADPVAYAVAVEEVLKGDAAARVVVISARFGASCGLEGVEEGDDYVVFAAYQDIEGKQTEELWASLCGGTTRASGSNVAEVEAVTGSGHPPEQPQPDQPSGTDTGPAIEPADEPGAASSGIPGWVWAGGAAAALGIGALLVALRRRSGA